jgi:hypothetical protein
MPPEAQAYYLPVLTFLNRANDAHTILPFENYMHSYVMGLDCDDFTIILPEIPSLVHLRGFIEDRIAESIITCTAYCMLLSNSLGAQARFFSLDEMLYKIASIQREINIQNRAAHLVEDLAVRAQVREQHKKGLVLDLGLAGQVFAIPELVYFLFQQVISNAFKASFGAYHLQRKEPDKPIAPGYEGMGMLEEPRVEISLARQDVSFVKVVVQDNGMGVPQNMLGRLIATTDEERLGCFSEIQVSNGSSTALFPFLVDLMGFEMFMQSEGIGRGFRTELLLPVDMNTRNSDR